MNTKRIITIFLSVIITVLSFTGCTLSVVNPTGADDPKDVLVTFNMNYEDSPQNILVTAVSGKTDAPVPEREGFTFTGWFLDKRMRTAFNFETILTEDTTLYAGWQKVYNDGDIVSDYVDTTAFESFSASTRDVLTNEETQVTFFAEIASQDYIEGEEIAVFSGNNKICLLNDDGLDGDRSADDGVFSGNATLYSDERKIAKYHAKFDDMVSEAFEICFYTNITEEEFDRALELSTSVSELESSSNVVNYITSSEDVTNYMVSQDGSSVAFTTDSGITCVWEERSEDENVKSGSNKLSVSASGFTYSDIEAKLNVSELNPAYDETDVCVIKPYRSTDFQYDDFETVGELITSELGGTLAVYEDANASRSVFKSFSDYGTVLLDSHGILAYNTPYLLTGESLNSWKNSADWNASRIVLIGNGVAVGSKFFDHYYEKDSLKDTMFFLGTCYSLYDNSISDVLINKGASVVFGFSNQSSVEYNNKTLFELVLNKLLVEGKTAGEAFAETVSVCGQTDPSVPITKFDMKGNSNYRLTVDTGRVSGRVQSVDTRDAVSNAFVRFTNRSTDETITVRTEYDGTFNARLPVGTYDARVSAYSYLDESTRDIVILSRTTNYLQNSILLHPAEDAVVSGNIINALTGKPVTEAVIRFRRNLGNTTGEYLTFVSGETVEIRPDENGNYYFDKLPVGYYTAEVTAESFITTHRNIIASNKREFVQDISLSPILSTEEIRVVLTWGEYPQDLDSHLVGPNGIHTWYDDLTAYVDDEPVADLDLDDVDSYGPETTTIRKIQPGVYYFYVHNFSTSPEMIYSGAQVKVYQGSNLLASYNIPSNVPDKLYWNVFKYDSVTGTITQNNTITALPNTNY